MYEVKFQSSKTVCVIKPNILGSRYRSTINSINLLVLKSYFIFDEVKIVKST